MGTYQYTKINAIELKTPKYCIRVVYHRIIVRKIGISCGFYIKTTSPLCILLIWRCAK